MLISRSQNFAQQEELQRRFSVSVIYMNIYIVHALQIFGKRNFRDHYRRQR
jgi:hypothetical protein